MTEKNSTHDRIARAERIIHDGRCLTSFDQDGERVIGWPEMVYESVRGCNYVTALWNGVIFTPPVIYDALGNLRGAAYLFPQAFEQMAGGLGEALKVADLHLVEDDGEDSAERINDAATLLIQAAGLARQLGETLELAQRAINRTGYTVDGDG